MEEESRICDGCGTVNPAGNQFCGKCGEKFFEVPAAAKDAHTKGARPLCLAVALLNLTGLGFGYLVLKYRMRWLLHFAVSVGLIAAAHLMRASRAPVLWIVILCLWLGWMAFDGWRLSGTPPTKSTSDLRAWLFAGIAIMFLGLEGVAMWRFSVTGRQEFSRGVRAYADGDCVTAMKCFNQVVSVYELTLSRDIRKAESKIEECSLIVFAGNARNQNKFADAIRSLESYMRLYPESPLVPRTRESIAEIYHEWAAQVRQEGKYQAAVDKYQIILGGYPETMMGTQARDLAAETIIQWAQQLQADGNYAGAIQKYEMVFAEYADTPSVDTAEELMPSACWDWAEDMHDQDKLPEEMAAHQMIIDRFPDSSYAADSAGILSGLYTTATNRLGRGGDCSALPLLEAFIEAGGMYSNEAEDVIPQALFNCGMEKHWQLDFFEAGEYYRTLIADYPGSTPADQARVALEAVEADERCTAFHGDATEVGPFSPLSYTDSDTASIEITNDAVEGIEVLFCAGTPDSRSLRIEGCPSCQPYESRPTRARSIAPFAEIRLAPGYYEMLVLCDSCPSPLSSEALRWDWYVNQGEQYTIFHYKVRESSYPWTIPTIPVIPAFPTLNLPDIPPLVTPSGP